MRRVNAIWQHPLYQTYYRRLEELEQDRPFCRHQMSHLLDTARIACIRSLEAGLGLDREVIYAAAILHDIGKSLQYEKQIPHEAAVRRIAAEILGTLPPDAAFSEAETEMILTAIEGHRRLRPDPQPSGTAPVRERQGIPDLLLLSRRTSVRLERRKKNKEILI